MADLLDRLITLEPGAFDGLVFRLGHHCQEPWLSATLPGRESPLVTRATALIGFAEARGVEDQLEKLFVKAAPLDVSRVLVRSSSPGETCPWTRVVAVGLGEHPAVVVHRGPHPGEQGLYSSLLDCHAAIVIVDGTPDERLAHEVELLASRAWSEETFALRIHLLEGVARPGWLGAVEGGAVVVSQAPTTALETVAAALAAQLRGGPTPVLRHALLVRQRLAPAQGFVALMHHVLSQGGQPVMEVHLELMQVPWQTASCAVLELLGSLPDAPTVVRGLLDLLSPGWIALTDVAPIRSCLRPGNSKGRWLRVRASQPLIGYWLVRRADWTLPQSGLEWRVRRLSTPSDEDPTDALRHEIFAAVRQELPTRLGASDVDVLPAEASAWLERACRLRPFVFVVRLVSIPERLLEWMRRFNFNWGILCLSDASWSEVDGVDAVVIGCSANATHALAAWQDALERVQAAERPAPTAFDWTNV